MDLTRQHPGDKVYVRAVGTAGITVANQTYGTALILTPDSIDADWPVTSVNEIQEQALAQLLGHEPELVLLGTGEVQRFPDPEIMMQFHSRGVGIEVMDTRAACRTFNVLVIEERRVVAALLPL